MTGDCHVRFGERLVGKFHRPTHLDLVQINPGSIGPLFDGFREVLDPWLGNPNKKLGQGRATLLYRFHTSGAFPIKMKLKVEINAREHFSTFDLKTVPFSVDSPWYKGNANVITYTIEELLGTKLRALFQRRKGRDLYDLAIALRQLPINIEKVLHCFSSYMDFMGLKVSRAEFEENLLLKKTSEAFRNDINPLLAIGNKEHDFDQDFNLVWREIIAKLPGEAWNGLKEELTLSIS